MQFLKYIYRYQFHKINSRFYSSTVLKVEFFELAKFESLAHDYISVISKWLGMFIRLSPAFFRGGWSADIAGWLQISAPTHGHRVVIVI